MYNFRLGLAALAAPLLLFGCTKEQADTPTPANQEQTADATTADGRCPSNFPVQLPGYSDVACGCLDATDSKALGLSENMDAYLEAGATLDFLASAMMESPNMTFESNTNDHRTLDAYRVGAAYQNWYMIRASSNPAFPNGGGGPKNYKNADRLNGNKQLEVQAYLLGVQRYGLDTFLAGQYSGKAGIDNPNTADIKRYRAAHAWTKQQIAIQLMPNQRTSNQRTPNQPTSARTKRPVRTYWHGGPKRTSDWSWVKYYY